MFSACDSKEPATWSFDFTDITGEPVSQSENVAIDLYLDSTESMSGFVSSQGSTLISLVRDLDSAARTGWQRVAVRYFKFGTSVEEVQHEPFVLGMRDVSFFRQKGMFEDTNLDAVLEQADAGRVTVVLTDLFQRAGNLNAVVGVLKDKVIAKDIALGILPVLSEFAGTVYDANVPPYAYRSTPGEPSTHRAFYLLMFGNRQDLQRLVDVLGAKPYIDRSKFLVLSRQVVKSQAASLANEKFSKNLVETTLPPDGPNEFVLDLRGTEASFSLRIHLTPADASPRLNAERLEISVVKRAATQEAESEDLTLVTPIRDRGDGTLELDLKLHFADPAGRYSYRLDVRTPTLQAFAVPAWVSELDSSNPTATFEPNKTLNLESFVAGLLQAQMSVHRSTVARVFFKIRKR